LNIKLIALDMDGTVLRTDKTISPKTMEVLRAAQARGIHIVPTTGRPRKMIPQPILDVGSIRYAITSNGASLADLVTDSILYSNIMTRQETDHIISFLAGYNLFVEAYCEGDSYTDKENLKLIPTFKDFPPIYVEMIMRSQTFIEDMPGFIKRENKRLEKINVPYLEPGVYEEVLAKLLTMKDYAITSSFLENIEINRATANKGEALGHLCKLLGIPAEQVMAFGDGSNDLEMLQFAGFGVAMGNAIEPLRPLANYITRSNEEDGVAYAIEKFIDL